MRVLVVVERLPSRVGGGAARQFSLIRELAQQHEFTVVYPASSDDELHLPSLAPYVRRLEAVEYTPPSPRARSRLYWQLNALRRALLDPKPLRSELAWGKAMRRTLGRLLAKERFDVIQVHQTHLGQLIPRTQVASVLDMHDILSDHERRIVRNKAKASHRVHAWLEWKKMQALERRVVRRFDVCATVSEHDKASLLALVPEARAVVVPNGVDTSYFCPKAGALEGGLDGQHPLQLVFTGSMGYGPNSDGVLWFYRTVFDLIRQRMPEVHFNVVGANPPPVIEALNADPGVTVTGFVEDVRPYLAAGAVMVVPLRLGSGTRLKILDGWAMEKAIVSTTLGAEGLEAVPGEDILLADEPERFADCVHNLLVDREMRARLGQAGRRVVESRYDWAVIAPKLGQVYESLQRPVRRSA